MQVTAAFIPSFIRCELKTIITKLWLFVLLLLYQTIVLPKVPICYHFSSDIMCSLVSAFELFFVNFSVLWMKLEIRPFFKCTLRLNFSKMKFAERRCKYLLVVSYCRVRSYILMQRDVY